jgi:hypothetical protein
VNAWLLGLLSPVLAGLIVAGILAVFKRPRAFLVRSYRAIRQAPRSKLCLVLFPHFANWVVVESPMGPQIAWHFQLTIRTTATV